MAKYDLVGVDGNAFSVMGYVANAMKHEGFTRDEIKKYQDEAMSGDYNNLLCVSMDYIDRCNDHAYENGYEDVDDEDNWEDDEWDEDYDNEW